MNICFVNFNKNWGGVKTWTLDYGRELAKKGHNITTIVRPDTPFADECLKAGFDVHAFRPGMKYNPVSIIKTVSILKKNKVDITIVNISKDINIGAVASKIASIPVIRRVGLPQDIKLRREEHFLAKFYNSIIVPSNNLKNEIKDLPQLVDKKIFVIPNSKKPELFKDKVHKGNEITIGVTSQLSVTKGHKYLIDAVKALHDRKYKIKLKISGIGGHEAELKALVEEQKIEENVEFCGFTRDIPAFLSKLDIFVLPSLTENFPNTLVEAMFANLPCLAFNTGGVPEVLGDTGALIQPKDTEKLTLELEKLIKNPELRENMGKDSKERALKEFNLSVNSSKIEEIFSEVISNS